MRSSGALRPRRLAAGLLAFLLAAVVAAGCSSSGVDESSSSDAAAPAEFAADEAAPSDGASAGDAATESAAGGSGSGVDPAVAAASANRELILTGSVAVVVADLDRAVTRVGRIATGAGGLVFGEQTSRTSDPGSVLTLKVPPASFERVLDDVAALGEAEDRQIGSEDVTSQVVDLDSRIATAEASVERLRALILRADDIADIAVLESELLNRETTLETLRGQRRTIGDQVALATITVTLTPTPDSPDTPQDEPDELPGFLDAFRGGWDALVKVATVVGLVLFALLPWLPLVLVVWAAAHVARRWYRRRHPAGAGGSGSGPAGGGFPPPPPSAPAPPAPPAPEEPQRAPVSAGAGSDR
ncbi:MAG: DUF4349 domain-containing protein [Acidimicrobiales bacterium]|nr:DUF4349 domain-containing protein [Acidimicrobiales bacterium]